MTINSEAVEAAARGLARHKWPTAIGVWEEFGQGMQDDFRDQAHAALEAAAPFIQADAGAKALEDAADDGNDAEMPWWVEDWLRARAAAVRGEG